MPEGYAPYCLAHGASGHIKRARKESLRNYNLDRWNAKLNQKADSEGVKSLRDEIGILRVVLEERLNKCQDAHDLILQSGPISDLVMKIERVVTSCHKLEGSMGQLLDKQSILQFAQRVIAILSTHLNEDQLNVVAEEIIDAISS